MRKDETGANVRLGAQATAFLKQCCKYKSLELAHIFRSRQSGVTVGLEGEAEIVGTHLAARRLVRSTFARRGRSRQVTFHGSSLRLPGFSYAVSENDPYSWRPPLGRLWAQKNCPTPGGAETSRTAVRASGPLNFLYMAAHKSQKPASAAASNAIYLSLIFGRPVFPPRRTSTKCLK